MQNKVFLDTNILIYIYSDTEPKKKDVTLNILESNTVVISTQVINEFIWTLSKKYGINMDKLEVIVNKFWQKFEIVLINKASVDKAISISKQYKFSYWDSLVLASALEYNCSSLFTEDMQSGQIIDKNLKIINPYIISLEKAF